MPTSSENLAAIASLLFGYIEGLFFGTQGRLELERLPKEFHKLAEGLNYFGECLGDARRLAKELSAGNLGGELPPPGNEIAAPLKSLHASLRHLTWQSQQVASGDYSQRVHFMGEFSDAFNNMTQQLEKQRQASQNEKSRLQMYVRLMLENSPDPILLFDNDLRLAYASASALRLFGIEGNAEGESVRALLFGRVSDELLTELEDMLKAAARDGGTQKADRKFKNFDGEMRHYQLQVSPMPNSSGELSGLMIMFHDTTELVSAREAAESSSRAKSDFLSRMSHEMRTPMNGILGMAAIYQTEKESSGRDYCVGKITEAAKHLLGIIDDVLDATNIDSNKFELAIADFDLKKLIEDVTSEVRYRANERDQTLDVVVEDGVPRHMRGDRRRLNQVIGNLLSNAVKFTPSGGKIALHVAARNSNLIVTVADNGIGIGSEYVSRLFTAFEQTDGGSARRHGGIGLGLAISKHIIELMRGRIWMQPNDGGGCIFGFEVPLVRVKAKKPVESMAIDGIFRGRKILAVEDVPLNAQILAALLAQTGAEITVASDGNEAIEAFLSQPQGFDLILMDINMPNMDGYEATRRIRASSAANAAFIPIVAMTANVFKSDIDRCLAAGMNAHIPKPLDVKDLIDTLSDFLV